MSETEKPIAIRTIAAWDEARKNIAAIPSDLKSEDYILKVMEELGNCLGGTSCQIELELYAANLQISELKEKLILEEKKAQYSSIECSFANHRMEWAILNPLKFKEIVNANVGGILADEVKRTLAAIDERMKLDRTAKQSQDSSQ